MPEYLSPAVYVEELSSGVKPIQGVGTSTAGFVGHAVKGPIGVATPINNFSEFQKKFGGFFSNGFLAFAVKAFFDEGGSSCYVVRTRHYDNNGNATAIAANRTYNAVGNASQQSLFVEATSAGAWGNELAINVQHPGATPGLFQLQVFLNGVLIESYERLSMDPNLNDHVETRINGVSELIKVTDMAKASTLSMADRRPTPTTGTTADPLQNGDDGLSNITADDYIGKESLGNGLHAFDKIDDVNIIAIPDALNRDVHVRGMGYCENRQDCFYIADSQETITTADEVLKYKGSLGVAVQTEM
jgi:uncharacterized protein